MSPSRSGIPLVLAAIGLFLAPAPLLGQRRAPEWVNMTPSGKRVVKTWEIGGGKLGIRGGLLVHPGPKAIFMGALAKPESMRVDLFLDVFNDSPNTLWVEMEIDVPGEKQSVEFAEIKAGRGRWQAWELKETQWGFQYPAKVSAYSDKKKTNFLGSTTASLAFDEADRAKLVEARDRATQGLRDGGLTYVTLSGWEKLSAEEMAAAKKKEEEKHPIPSFEWKESEESPSVSLMVKEVDRKSGRDEKGTMVQIELSAAGFGAGEDLTLWTKWLDDKYEKMIDVSLDEKGIILGKYEGKAIPFRLTVGGMAAGEPISWALVSATTNKRAYARAVIVPIESHSAEGCSASAELVTPSGFVFLVTFRGFAPGEEVATTSEFKKENKSSAGHADDKGVLAFPVLFGEGDHGKARATAAGKSCKVALEYQVGPDARATR